MEDVENASRAYRLLPTKYNFAVLNTQQHQLSVYRVKINKFYFYSIENIGNVSRAYRLLPTKYNFAGTEGQA
jgi:hypothetical protein